jgi:hypothetical protein
MESKTHRGAADGDRARAARREQARAELAACDREARTAQAEAELRQARHAELAAEIDEIARWQSRVEREEWQRDYDRRQQTMEQLRALANEPLPTVPVSRAELEADLAQLDAYLDRHQQAEQDRLWRETDQNETRRLFDWDFRRSYDRRHPGRERGECDCPGHRAWRREPPR